LGLGHHIVLGEVALRLLLDRIDDEAGA
jgi:hypothetical protein